MDRKGSIVLGISAYFHDSAVAFIIDNEVVYAAEEERFSGLKHDNSFPSLALQNGLQTLNIDMSEVDKIVFYEKPFLKFERILETTVRYAPKSIGQFLKAIPLWLGSRLNLRKQLIKEIHLSTSIKVKNKDIAFVEHHTSHAASAFYPSGYDSAAYLIVDGVGEWASISIGEASSNEGIRVIKQQNFPDSLGLLYSSFTYFLGFKVNNGEYKMMGLSPFGDEHSEEFKQFKTTIETELVTINPDGSIKLNLSYFKFHFSNRMIDTEKWESLLGIKQRTKENPLNLSHANLALSIQRITEEIILKLANTTYKLAPSPNLVMAGGVAYNCVSNGNLLEKSKFKNIWIQPAAGDNGAAIGAALHYDYLHHKSLPAVLTNSYNFLGNVISTRGLSFKLKNSKKYRLTTGKNTTLVNEIAQLIKANKVVGIIQGAMEFGPRALGARSIIANPRNINNKLIINEKIKGREDFRPFAPVMLLDEANKYFGIEQELPYMQFVKKIKPEYRHKRTDDWSTLSIKERSQIPTSIFGAISHVDFSSRLQVITNPLHPFYNLLTAVKKETGDGILLNTSFNTGGKPIANDLNSIIDIFENTPMHALLLNDTLVIKAES